MADFLRRANSLQELLEIYHRLYKQGRITNECVYITGHKVEEFPYDDVTNIEAWQSFQNLYANLPKFASACFTMEELQDFQLYSPYMDPDNEQDCKVQEEYLEYKDQEQRIAEEAKEWEPERLCNRGYRGNVRRPTNQQCQCEECTHLTCEKCRVVLYSKSNMRRHKRYSCKEIQKQETQRDKEFTAQLCNRNPGIYIRHQTVQNCKCKECRNLTCKHCGIVFSDMHNLCFHIKSTHRI